MTRSVRPGSKPILLNEPTRFHDGSIQWFYQILLEPIVLNRTGANRLETLNRKHKALIISNSFSSVWPENFFFFINITVMRTIKGRSKWIYFTTQFILIFSTYYFEKIFLLIYNEKIFYVNNKLVIKENVNNKRNKNEIYFNSKH